MGEQPELAFGDPLQTLIRENASQFRAGFSVWLALNRPVWDAFEREADRVWNRGRRHYSARTLVEYLRHETAIADREATFKLNGNAVPDMARLYRLAHPERADLFETRVMPGSERAA